MVANVNGEWHPTFSGVADLLAAQTDEASGGGGALAVFHRGEKVVDIWAGARDPDALLHPVYKRRQAIVQLRQDGVTG